MDENFGENESGAADAPRPFGVAQESLRSGRAGGDPSSHKATADKQRKIKPRHDGPSTGSGCTEPIKTIKYRHDGFTPKKRRRFFRVLAKTGCISDAARVAGISTTTVDRWRRKDMRFARMCETALDKAAAHIELLAWERAVTGIEEPVYHYGKFSHMRVKRSDAIFRMLLIASNKKKYGRMGAVGRGMEKGRLPKVATNAEVREALLNGLRAFRARKEAERAARAGHGEGGEDAGE